MFNSILGTTLTIETALICMLCSLVLGLAIALVHTVNKRYSKNFIITLAILPLLVQVVIMMVNGNLGTSVAILGSFTLIRFRSMPGTSSELISVFFAMAVGLAIGMGYIGYAVVFTIFTSLVILVLHKTKFGENKKEMKKLKITIPENLDYNGIFDEIFDKYTSYNTLEMVKTTNMGSLYELIYDVIIEDEKLIKNFIDELRCRNGNLNISIGRVNSTNEL